MKRIETFLNIFFMIACITHVSFIGYYSINPVLPEIKIYSKPLKDIEFPLVFRLCTNKLLNLNHSESLFHSTEKNTKARGIGGQKNPQDFKEPKAAFC